MCRGFSLAGVASLLLAWSGHSDLYLSCCSDVSEDSASPTVEDSEQDLGELPIGDHLISFRVVNRSAHTVQLYGFPNRCGDNCCYYSRKPARRKIMPGTADNLVGELVLSEAGPFEFQGSFFLSHRDRLRTIKVKISGIVVAMEKLDANPSQP